MWGAIEPERIQPKNTCFAGGRSGRASALGKKGTYNETQATYTVPLPRHDLNVTIKGAAGVPELVPIPFGFGGLVGDFRDTDHPAGAA